MILVRLVMVAVALFLAASAGAAWYEPVSQELDAYAYTEIYHEGRYWPISAGPFQQVLGAVTGRHELSADTWDFGGNFSTYAWVTTDLTTAQLAIDCVANTSQYDDARSSLHFTFDVPRTVPIRLTATLEGGDAVPSDEFPRLVAEATDTVIWEPYSPQEFVLAPGRYTLAVYTECPGTYWSPGSGSGQHCHVALTFTAVPEPSTGVLLAALGGLLWRPRRHCYAG